MLPIYDVFWWSRPVQADIKNTQVYNVSPAVTTLAGAHPVVVYADMALFDTISQVYVTTDQTTRSVNS
jgi:hypothetical protein